MNGFELKEIRKKYKITQLELATYFGYTNNGRVSEFEVTGKELPGYMTDMVNDFIKENKE